MGKNKSTFIHFRILLFIGCCMLPWIEQKVKGFFANNVDADCMYVCFNDCLIQCRQCIIISRKSGLDQLKYISILCKMYKDNTKN